MRIKYIGSVGTRHLLFFHNVLLRRVPFTNYIVSGCNWKKIDDGKRATIEIAFEETPGYKLLNPYQNTYKRTEIYKRMGVLDLIRLGWIYLRRER